MHASPVSIGTLHHHQQQQQALGENEMTQISRRVNEILHKLQSMENMNAVNAQQLKAGSVTVDAAIATTRRVVTERLTQTKIDMNAVRGVAEDVQRCVRLLEERRCLHRRGQCEELQKISHEIKFSAQAAKQVRDREIHCLKAEIRSMREDIKAALTKRPRNAFNKESNKRRIVNEDVQIIPTVVDMDDDACRKAPEALSKSTAR